MFKRIIILFSLSFALPHVNTQQNLGQFDIDKVVSSLTKSQAQVLKKEIERYSKLSALTTQSQEFVLELLTEINEAHMLDDDKDKKTSSLKDLVVLGLAGIVLGICAYVFYDSFYKEKVLVQPLEPNPSDDFLHDLAGLRTQIVQARQEKKSWINLVKAFRKNHPGPGKNFKVRVGSLSSSFEVIHD